MNKHGDEGNQKLQCVEDTLEVTIKWACLGEEEAPSGWPCEAMGGG